MTESASADISAKTRCCAVLGHPIRHSASPAMHNAAFRVLGLDWRYLAFDVLPADLGEAVRGAKAMRYVGLNLTVPHKQAAVGLVDALDDEARRWGAVNTIVFEVPAGQGTWVPVGQGDDPGGPLRSRGCNTDADALARALRADLELEPRGASVLLLGAGGVGRVAAWKLSAEGVRQLYVVNRTESRAAALAAELRRQFPNLDLHLGYPPGEIDLVLNATSLGLDLADPLPLDTGAFPLRRARAVYDMIYRPSRTLLLQAAQAAGCRWANGAGMLLDQGAAALELWTGQAAPRPVMREALEQHLAGSGSH